MNRKGRTALSLLGKRALAESSSGNLSLKTEEKHRTPLHSRRLILPVPNINSVLRCKGLRPEYLESICQSNQTKSSLRMKFPRSRSRNASHPVNGALKKSDSPATGNARTSFLISHRDCENPSPPPSERSTASSCLGLGQNRRLSNWTRHKKICLQLSPTLLPPRPKWAMARIRSTRTSSNCHRPRSCNCLHSCRVMSLQT